MDDRKRTEEGPLSSEELAQDEWRDGGTYLEESDAPGHTLPESERDRARMKPGSGDDTSAPGTIFPPD